MTKRNFLFTELTSDILAFGKAFDGLVPSASGEPFVDARGKAVVVSADALPEIYNNTLAAIEATRSESGEIVGLPIDAKGHDKGDGAGWIVGAFLEGDKIRLLPKWTEIGQNVIGKNIRRFFSPSVDLTNNVILGGTLTNWPASRRRNGQILLRPVELETKIFRLEEVVMDEELEAVETPEETPAPSLAELMKADPSISKDVNELVTARVKDGIKAELARIQRDHEVSELAARLTGGTEDKPRGIPVPADELSAFLLSLDDQAREKAEAIFNKIVETGTVEFGELGHSKQVKGKTPFPEVMKPSLLSWLGAKGTIAEYFTVNAAELGNAADYDLSEFKEKE